MSKPLSAAERASIKNEMARISAELNYELRMNDHLADDYTTGLMEKHAKLHDKLYAEEV